MCQHKEFFFFLLIQFIFVVYFCRISLLHPCQCSILFGTSCFFYVSDFPFHLLFSKMTFGSLYAIQRRKPRCAQLSKNHSVFADVLIWNNFCTQSRPSKSIKISMLHISSEHIDFRCVFASQLTKQFHNKTTEATLFTCFLVEFRNCWVLSICGRLHYLMDIDYKIQVM